MLWTISRHAQPSSALASTPITASARMIEVPLPPPRSFSLGRQHQRRQRAPQRFGQSDRLAARAIHIDMHEIAGRGGIVLARAEDADFVAHRSIAEPADAHAGVDRLGI